MDDPTRPDLPGGTFLTAAERQEAARSTYRESLLVGAALTPVALGQQFGRSRRWADDRIAEVRAQFTNGHGGGSSTEDDGTDTRGPSPVAPVAPTPAVTPAVRRVTIAAVLAVAGVAALASYDHQRQLAAIAGEGWRAWLLPVSVDGMVIAASMTMLVRRRIGEPAGALAWFALLLGGAASVVANVAAADPTLAGRLVAAWPPVALLVSYELLLKQVRSVSLAEP
jgi:hypothetical protein